MPSSAIFILIFRLKTQKNLLQMFTIHSITILYIPSNFTVNLNTITPQISRQQCFFCRQAESLSAKSSSLLRTAQGKVPANFFFSLFLQGGGQALVKVVIFIAHGSRKISRQFFFSLFTGRRKGFLQSRLLYCAQLKENFPPIFFSLFLQGGGKSFSKVVIFAVQDSGHFQANHLFIAVQE
jgi:hypothetical protein